MADLTRRALAQALQELLEQKPLEKVTVKELTDYCGLTRNTFYYHFHDILELLDWIFTSEAERLIKVYEGNQEWEDGFEEGLNFLYANKRMIDHVYKSINRELLDSYLQEMVYRHALTVVKAESRKYEVSDEAVAVVADFYKNAIIGAVISWIEQDMKEAPEELAKLYNSMFVGTIEAALKSAEKGLE